MNFSARHAGALGRALCNQHIVICHAFERRCGRAEDAGRWTAGLYKLQAAARLRFLKVQIWFWFIQPEEFREEENPRPPLISPCKSSPLSTCTLSSQPAMEEQRIHLPPTSSTISLALLTLSHPRPLFTVSHPLSASPVHQSESAARSDSSHPSHRPHIYTRGGKHSRWLVMISTSSLHCAVLIILAFALWRWVQICQTNKQNISIHSF